MRDEPRTKRQNDSYYAWRKETSEEAISKGLDARQTFKEVTRIPLTEDIIHHQMHEILKAQFGIDSTAKATRGQLSTAVDILRGLYARISNGEVNVPFGDEPPMMTDEEAERMFQQM